MIEVIIEKYGIVHLLDTCLYRYHPCSVYFQTDSIHSASSLDEGEAHIMVQGLQEELISVRLREAENSTVLKNLHNKIQELQQVS